MTTPRLETFAPTAETQKRLFLKHNGPHVTRLMKMKFELSASLAHLFRFAFERPGAGFFRTLNFRFVRIYTRRDSLSLRPFEHRGMKGKSEFIWKRHRLIDKYFQGRPSDPRIL
jgi:hypothetical protein